MTQAALVNISLVVLQDRFKDWEASGVQIVPVLSQPTGSWNGEQGYVQVCISQIVLYVDLSLFDVAILSL